MGKREAVLAARENKMNGYYHHSYEEEKMFFKLFLEGNARLDDTTLPISYYADIIGPTPIRAMRNSLICLITLVCRRAADYGIDTELCFSLSDYYINEVEKASSKPELQGLKEEVLTHYSDLIKEHRLKEYSQPVTRAVYYITRHIYEPLRVKEIAGHLGFNTNYLSSLFKKETGKAMSAFIRTEKLKNARELLASGMEVTKVADVIGYGSLSYFSADFKKEFGISPSKYPERDCI